MRRHCPAFRWARYFLSLGIAAVAVHWLSSGTADGVAPGRRSRLPRAAERGGLLTVRRTAVSKLFSGCRFAMKRQPREPVTHRADSDLGWRESAVIDWSLNMRRVRA
jgi:hypothetical protein